MKKIIRVLIFLLIPLLLGFDTGFFKLKNLENYTKEYKTEDMEVCSVSSTKSYMDYRMITATTSRQYKYIRKHMEVSDTGLLIDKDGFIGVAMGFYFGEIGSKYYVTLDSKTVLPLVKVEEKAAGDTDPKGCFHYSDNSVIEFVIDRDKALNYFGSISNSHVLNGNFNNYKIFQGEIRKIEKVLEEKQKNTVVFVEEEQQEFDNTDIFKDTSGY